MVGSQTWGVAGAGIDNCIVDAGGTNAMGGSRNNTGEKIWITDVVSAATARALTQNSDFFVLSSKESNMVRNK